MGTVTGEREFQVWQQLALVSDPELDESVTDLGFVREVKVDDDVVSVRFGLPTYWCAANFAFLMAHDMQEAVQELPWVGELQVELCDHFYADKINAGLANRASFQETCGEEAAAELNQLRTTFRGKAFQARQERLLSHLFHVFGLKAESLCDLSLTELSNLNMDDDVEGAKLRRRYLAMRRSGILAELQQGGASRDDLPGERAFLTLQGEPLQAESLIRYIREIRSIRLNMEFNGHMCRSVLEARQGKRQTVTVEGPRPVQAR